MGDHPVSVSLAVVAVSTGISRRITSGVPPSRWLAFRSTMAGAPSARAATWSAEKIEAIDQASDFWWVDDDPSDNGRDWLRANGREDRLIVISVNHDPDAAGGEIAAPTKRRVNRG
jgi:hypothetical protein